VGYLETIPTKPPQPESASDSSSSSSPGGSSASALAMSFGNLGSGENIMDFLFYIATQNMTTGHILTIMRFTHGGNYACEYKYRRELP
jgi:hypothetical protein